MTVVIPSAVTDEEAAALEHLAENRLVYEAGALLGRSTIALAKCARLVVSVDPHDGYPGATRHQPGSLSWQPRGERLRLPSAAYPGTARGLAARRSQLVLKAVAYF